MTEPINEVKEQEITPSEESKKEIEADEKPAKETKETKENGVEDKKELSDVDTEEEKDEKKSEEEDNEEESSEEELGSLEKPVEILSRKRDRKSTERFVDIKAAEKPTIVELDYSKGKGKVLGDIEYIAYMINKTKAEELRSTFRVLYPAPQKPKAQFIRGQIKKFQGYPFEKDSKDYDKMQNRIERMVAPDLKFVCGILGLEKKGDKNATIEKLIEYLMEPKDIERSIPTQKSKRKSSSGKKKKSKSKKEKDSSKTDGASEDKDQASTAGESSDEEGEADAEETEETDEKKAKKTPAKKTPAKKTPGKSPTKKKDTKKAATQVKISLPSKKKKEKKEEAKKSKDASETKRKHEESNGDTDDEEVPLAKKSKSDAKKEPTDSQLEVIVQEILKDADLEKVTMKTVCKQVYDRFPDFDLTPRKDFIKTTVKKIISWRSPWSLNWDITTSESINKHPLYIKQNKSKLLLYIVLNW